MKKRGTILVDQDGVLANYSKRLISIAGAEYPDERPFTEVELTLFETHQHYSHRNQKAIDQIALRPGFFEGLEPIDGAIEALHNLVSVGFNVRICTAPKKIYINCVVEKLAWIEKHFGKDFVRRTILTRDKTLVRGSILIDDKPEVTGSVEPEWEHVLFDRPYNRHLTEKRRLNWQNYQEVLGLAG